MAAEKIGDARCPCCSSTGARVSLSKSGLAVLTCNACNVQVFTRSGRSDELIRALIIKPASAPAAPAPAPIKAAAVPAPVPEPEPKKRGFGLMQW